MIAGGLHAYHLGAVVRGLRFEHVGDGNQTDVETLLHLFELALDRSLGGFRGIEKILGAQHVQIGDHCANDEILLGRLVVPLCAFHARQASCGNRTMLPDRTPAGAVAPARSAR